jgi:hypothetical protein
VSCVSDRRVAELTAASLRPSFGSLQEVRGSDFVLEVTKASEVHPVVCHLYAPTQRSCHSVRRHLQTLAKRFPHTKFIDIVAVECIPNYPAHRCPTLLVYLKGDLAAQVVGIDAMGGADGCSAAHLEWRLKEAQAIEGSRLTVDPFVHGGGGERMKIHRGAGGGGGRSGAIRSSAHAGSDDDDEDEDDES